MKITLIILTHLLVFLGGSACQKNGSDPPIQETANPFSVSQFEQLLQTVAEGWNESNARKAADCFTIDAVYIEPPDRQLYKGREALFEFFGGDAGRVDPMKMTFHHLLYNEDEQIGAGEYTFSYKGRETHGIVIVKIKSNKIHRWREYQYRSEVSWEEFVGESAF